MTSTPEFSSDTERGEHVSLRTPRGDSSEAFRSLRNALLLLSHILILSVFATITRALPMLSKAFSALHHKHLWFSYYPLTNSGEEKLRQE